MCHRNYYVFCIISPSIFGWFSKTYCHIDSYHLYIKIWKKQFYLFYFSYNNFLKLYCLFYYNANVYLWLDTNICISMSTYLIKLNPKFVYLSLIETEILNKNLKWTSPLWRTTPKLNNPPFQLSVSLCGCCWAREGPIMIFCPNTCWYSLLITRLISYLYCLVAKGLLLYFW